METNSGLTNILEKFDLIPGIPELNNFTREYGKFLKSEYSKGNIDILFLEELIEGIIYAQAERDLNLIKKRGKSEELGHLGSERSLAYALNKGYFSKTSLIGTNFTNKELRNDFCNQYRDENLVENLIERLFNPKKYNLLKGQFDHHPTCC